MMKIAGFWLALLAPCGPSWASSISVLPAGTSGPTPSLVSYGGSQAPVVEARAIRGEASTGENPSSATVYLISPSVIAYGADAIPPANEKVAAIGVPAEAPRRFNTEAFPLVIRGGIAGSAFSAPPAPSASPPTPALPAQPAEAASQSPASSAPAALTQPQGPAAPTRPAL